MKVLHIDDNQDITDLFSEFINSLGHTYFATNNSRDGLERIKNEKYDFIFLDMHMPKLSGIDVIESLEKEKILKDQKIVILSGFPFDNNQKKHLLNKQGIHGCLQKPIRFDQLVNAIAS
ncbi:MAG: response regulator [Nitrosopumilus sp.]|nr:response regulator [Nitrosopumilus sp.]